MTDRHPRFIRHAGGSVVSRNILNGTGRLHTAIREAEVNDMDNGWRFLSDIDDDAYLSNPDNLTVVDFNVVAEHEPLVYDIYTLPIGADLTLTAEKDGSFVFFDNSIGLPAKLHG